MSENKVEPIILVHGGAGDIPDSRVQPKLDGVRDAARLGYKILKETGCVTDATVQAVKLMENHEAFNAGRGSVLTRDGEVEMEALIMDGKTMKAGAVTCLKKVANPIDVARLVMEKSTHVILCGRPAKDFAQAHGVADVDNSYLITDDAVAALKNFLNAGGDPKTTEIGKSNSDGTVGAVGLDVDGNVVSCTSTGGMTGKLTGRVGDTPIPGAGGYADNSVGAVSTTGNGDAILIYSLAHRILMNMNLGGKNIQPAVQEALEGLAIKTKKTAGAIAVSKTGEIGVGFNSARMAWAYAKAGKIHFGIEPGEDRQEDI